ncbi:MAG: PepSY-associated TM helix domain-containing protein [Sphingobium sp.]
MAKRPVATREFWSRHLRQWHWISSAVCLVLMLMFAVTGITLNHADLFEGEKQSVMREFPLSPDLAAELSRLENGGVVPDAMAGRIEQQTGADVSGHDIQNQYGEIIFELARPGRDAVLTIDMNAAQIFYEETDRGMLAMFNDLHTGRHTGLAWKLLVDLGAFFFILFALTGFGLLLLHARMRALTWPLTSLGLITPIIVYLLLIH